MARSSSSQKVTMSENQSVSTREQKVSRGVMPMHAHPENAEALYLRFLERRARGSVFHDGAGLASFLSIFRGPAARARVRERTAPSR
jgi:hypothetical protein